MSPRVTLILAAVVAAVAAFVWFYEIEGADRRAEAESAEKRLFADVEPGDLQQLELTTTDGAEVRLERGDDGWKIVEPLSFPADEPAAQAAASALATLEADTIYTDPEPLENYGLGGDADVRGRTDGRELALVIGDGTPTGGKVYVAPEGDARVFTVASHRTNALRKSLQELRDTRVLDFDREAVREVEVGWVGGSVVARETSGLWRLTHPLETAADEETVDDIVSDLSFLRAEGFVDDPDAALVAGLDDPSLRVQLRDEEGKVLADLAVGPSADERRVVRGHAGLYEIAASRLDGLPRTVVAFRDKVLTRFETADAKAFELQFHEGGAPVLIAGTWDEEGGWQAAPEALAPGKASRLISELSSLEALDIAAEEVGQGERAGLGLSPPGAVLRVFGAGPPAERERLAELSLGVHQAGRGLAAQRRDDPVVYWLPEALAEHLPVDLEAFRASFRATEEPAADSSETPPDSAAAPAAEDAPMSVDP